MPEATRRGLGMTVSLSDREAAPQELAPSPSHQLFRDTMLRAKLEWENHCQLNADPSLSRETRLLARAYAGAYRVKLTDMNDALAGPLSPFECLRLPFIRSRIRRTNGLPHPIRMWWLMHPWAWVKASALLALFVIAFGWMAPLSASLAITKFLIDWYQGVAGLLLLVGALAWLNQTGFFRWLDSLQSSPPAPSPERGQAYTRKSDAVYGGARAADDWEIDEALRDKTGGFRRLFEE
jgi:hypothetical protein